MTPQSNKLYRGFISFIGMGIFILLLIVGLIFFSYLLIIAGIIGLILFIIAWIRVQFFKHKMKKQGPKNAATIHRGRTIDHDS